MGRGLPALGLVAGEEVTEQQLWNLFGEGGRHPDADRIVADRLAARDSPAAAWRAGALGRRVKVTGLDLVFRPQPTVYLLWALGDDETRRVIEAAHERAIATVLAWIEDAVAVLRRGSGGVHRARPAGGWGCTENLAKLPTRGGPPTCGNSYGHRMAARRDPRLGVLHDALELEVLPVA
jgi:hypothetical protein